MAYAVGGESMVNLDARSARRELQVRSIVAVKGATRGTAGAVAVGVDARALTLRRRRTDRQLAWRLLVIGGVGMAVQSVRRDGVIHQNGPGDFAVCRLLAQEFGSNGWRVGGALGSWEVMIRYIRN